MAARPGPWRVRPIRLLIVLLVTAAGLAGCTGGGDHDRGQASISASPLAALVDPGRLVATATPSPRACAPTGSPIR